MLWSYSSIARHMVTYASLVWWLKTKEQKEYVLLQKWLACVGITGAIRWRLAELISMPLHKLKDYVIPRLFTPEFITEGQ